MRLTIAISIISVFVLLSCIQQEENKKHEYLNGSILSDLLLKALNYDTVSNNKLSNLVDFSFPLNKDFNNLTIDSIIIKNDSIYYYVLLEYPNPVYNRFAVYNSSGVLLLIDKSLNGNIFIEKMQSGDLQFLKIDEVFLSKDTLAINRLSLYGVDTTGVSLSLRTHTKFVKPDIDFSQDIMELNDSLIITKINSSKRSLIDKKEDRFIYNSSQKKYFSSENIFDEFVKDEITNFKYERRGEEIF